MDEKEFYEKIIFHFGDKNQITVAIEELSELQKELCKYLRGDMDYYNIAEEIADVEIMLEQLKIIFLNESDVEETKKEKINRTIERYLR